MIMGYLQKWNTWENGQKQHIGKDKSLHEQKWYSLV